jgi:DNA-3-methyladenine glycosylase
MDMDENFFSRDAVTVAVDLLGTRLLIDGVGGVIVETEAYRQDDEASHSHRGQTAANAAMFGSPARVYVYRSYGLHWCLNFVCERGSAVLIRALEPTHGLETMEERRLLADRRRLCAGPGNLCKALGVTGGMNGLSVLRAPFALEAPAQAALSVSGKRIGISKAADRPWRFALQGSAYLSKPI